MRVNAEVLQDAIGEVRSALAEATGREPADVSVSEAQGGAVWRVRAKGEVTEETVSAALAELEGIDSTVKVKGNRVTVTVDDLPASPRDAVTEALAGYASVDAEDVTVNSVGPTWGAQVSRKAVQALMFFFILLIIYLSLRFEWKMAIAAIIAVVHDIAVTAGVYAVARFQVTPATVTAFLTILGFSLYDTVVVFDKVRENTASLATIGKTTYSEMVNRSLNQVLMRSLSTTLVALLPVVSLLVVGSVILGAVTLEDFALALLVGLLIGSYSSLFVAAPVLAWWKEREPQYAALRARYARAAAAAAGGAMTGSPTPMGTAAAGAAAAPGGPAPPGGGVVARARNPRRRKRG
ncbi:MAG: protein translocase subunit SecF [Acidimicrobiia bacterium]|nr:protein translocase subunit SecF [Acidimicrobiia bacterium]